ncbi:MAG TPA: protease HtpX [Smithella sp.]|nr:protease HtpX [Smithella sp.]MDM7986152.1 protease HtpX [Smithella sp.]HNY50931.1 protease HtpX [Smithella sp.]HOG90985.1 protease HtpX [Smithella sp.]HOU52008.1 protease HtpX [Smithella sp.]
MKRILLFLATNIAVLVVLSIVAHLLGADRFLTQNGLNMTSLLLFAAVFGFGGSFISLAMSKWMAKRMMGAEVITSPRNSTEAWLIETVKKLAMAANVGMPEVAIFDSPSPNAFATGMNKNNALVAVSTGLLNAMNKDEVEAVIGHEISHVANGDMVTLSLIQGVVNTFVIFLSRVVGYFVDRVILKNDDDEGVGIGFFVTSMIAQVLFGILASIIVMWFSRKREFIADAGGAKLAGTQSMINALEALKRGVSEPLPEQMAAFGISGKPSSGGLKLLFMSHPPLDDRIEALKKLTYR